MSAEPLYPFGFGLSYTSFAYGGLTISKTKIRRGEAITAEVTVTNTGKYASDEVAELYLTHENAGDSAALFALKGFQRVSLAPGDSIRVHFALTPDRLSVIDAKGQRIEPVGKIKISVAGSLPTRRSEDLGAAKAVVAEIEVVDEKARRR
jgi:beta-glucosidase